MARLAVIGGGISGLSTAYYLATQCAAMRVPVSQILLLESQDRCGGWIRTTHQVETGAIFEHGPRNMRQTGLAGFTTLELVDELGLKDEVIGIDSKHPGAKHRYLYCNKSVCPLPYNFPSLFKTMRPFSKSFVQLGWREPFQSSTSSDDESIHDFISLRLHPEFANYMISAICRGIYAGSSRELSIRSCLPMLWELDKDYGSIVKGIIKKPRTKLPPGNDLVKKIRNNKWSMWTLKGGLQQITDRLVEVLDDLEHVEILTSTACKHIHQTNTGGAVITTANDDVLEVDKVVSTTYARHTADMLPTHPNLARMLSRIPAVSVAVVTAEFPGTSLTLPGFGHLLPSTEMSKSLGVIYESSIWPQHDRAGDTPTTRLTIMMGGHWFREWFGEDKGRCAEDFIPLALNELKEQLGIYVEPLHVVASLHTDCIPQYRVGHYKIIEYLDEYLRMSALPLYLTGSSYRGVSVNDCVHHGKLTAEQVLAETNHTTLRTTHRLRTV